MKLPIGKQITTYSCNRILCACVHQVASVMSDSWQLHGLQPTRLLCPWDSPGKNPGVGCQALLQGIFPTQGSNPHLFCLLHWQAGSLPLEPPGKALYLSSHSCMYGTSMYCVSVISVRQLEQEKRSPKWRWLKDKEGKSPWKQDKGMSEDKSEDLR